MSITVLKVLAIALQALDAHSTYAVLRRGGSEANPLVGAVLSRLGAFWGLALTKAIAIGVIVLLEWPKSLLGGFCVVMTLVVLWNYFQLYRLRRVYVGTD